MVDHLDPAGFDLVWCHHDLLFLMPLGGVPAHGHDRSPPRCARRAVAVAPVRARRTHGGPVPLRAQVWANSEKTADADRGDESRPHPGAAGIHVFDNAAA